MSFSLSGLNKTVQESGIYKKIKPFLYEEGLSVQAKNKALKSVENTTAKKFKTIADSGQLNEEVDEAVSEAAKKFSNSTDWLDSLSAWKNMTAEEQKSIREAARARVLGKNYTADKASNIDDYVNEYAGAVNAVKRKANRTRALETVKGYYGNPIADGRLGTAAARIGGTIGVGVGAGAIINSLSDPYSQDY